MSTTLVNGLPSPTEIEGGLFGAGRRLLHAHTLESDAVMAAVLLALSTVWLVHSPFAGVGPALVQAGLIVPLVWRRSQPTLVFVVVAAVALAQWALDYRLLGDASLLIALYTVAVHETRRRAVAATGVVEIGAVLAAARWMPAGTDPRSFVFLSATAVAALCAGLTVRSGSEYMGWLAERAERLEIERDQQKAIGAAIERTRIAREVHDIVAHSLSVVITLADAAAVVNASDGVRATEAMHRVSEVGRQALGDMRTVISVLRTEEGPDEPEAEFGPPPDIAQLGPLFERVEATGLAVEVTVEGEAFALGPSAELTVYRIIQEALTNTIKHAEATRVRVVLRYRCPRLELTVADNGAAAPSPRRGGHGIEGMSERAGLHGGTLVAGPVAEAGVVGVDHTAIGDDDGGAMTIRVLLVDDQALLRQGFAMILAHEPDIEIVGEADDGQQAVTVARSCHPDVVLMDIRMPVIDGVEATRRIVSEQAEVRVLILTTFDLDAYAFGALRAGASGFVLKDVRPDELVAAIRTVASGDAVVSPRITRRLLDECAHLLETDEGGSNRAAAAMAQLTDREREVLVAVADGLSNSEIAERLFVSEATIKSHVGRILGKLGLRDRVQAVVFAFQTGIVRPHRTP